MTSLSAVNKHGDLIFGFATLFNIVKLHLDGHGDFVRNFSKLMYQLKDYHRLDSVIEGPFQYQKL